MRVLTQVVPHSGKMLILTLISTQNLDNRFGIHVYFVFGVFILKMRILTCNYIFIYYYHATYTTFMLNTLHILSPLILTIIPEGGHYVHLEVGEKPEFREVSCHVYTAIGNRDDIKIQV